MYALNYNYLLELEPVPTGADRAVGRGMAVMVTPTILLLTHLCSI